ncbi:DUF6538 domain-containing protein [Pararhizobium sp. LjRoot238]|uniref:DUF6538 domain-containing protein n=1 Tax=Pararhizobium sp. LjRoot238 TaxID=3342293 RepID=UPI003F4F9429
MAAIQHVFKRGSVYWWRRRLPNGTSSCALIRIELSLNTKNMEPAKLIASEVTLASVVTLTPVAPERPFQECL